MVTAILRAAEIGGDQAIAAPRGEGKTTTVECVVIFCILKGILRFPIICAATGPDAEQILTNIKLRFEMNELLAADFPEVCVPIRALEGAPQRAGGQTVNGKRTMIRWSGRKIVFPTVDGSRASGAVLMTRGLDAAIRGIRHGSIRPDLAIIDDPETRESVCSEEQTDRRALIIEQDIGGLAGSKHKLARVMLTTTMNRRSISFKYTDPKEQPSWRGKRYRQLLSKPDREDLWDEYIMQRQANQQEEDDAARGAHAYYLANRAEMDAGAEVANPESFSETVLEDGTQLEASALQRVYNLVADRGWSYVLCELQNDPPEEDEPTESGVTAYMIQHKRLGGYPKGTIPPDIAAVTAGIDVGKFACHWVVDAWRSDATSFRLDYGVQEVHGTVRGSDDAIERGIMAALHQWREETLAAPYRDAAGDDKPVGLTLVDAGYRADAVYQFCREVGGVLFRPAMGFGEATGAAKTSFRQPVRSSKDKKSGDHWFLSRQPRGDWLVCMDTDYWKRWLHDRIMTPHDRPGTFLMFGDDPKPHFTFGKHLTAEIEVEEFVRNKGMKRFWKKINKNNHYFDAAYMSAVAASMCGIRLLTQRKTVTPKRVSLSELQSQKRRRT
jgi:hypothetical protein